MIMMYRYLYVKLGDWDVCGLVWKGLYAKTM